MIKNTAILVMKNKAIYSPMLIGKVEKRNVFMDCKFALRFPYPIVIA